TRLDFLQIMNQVYETYGREVEIVRVDASGQATDDVAATNDAVRIAEEIGAFAVIGGPGLTNVFAKDVTTRGVLCGASGDVAPDSSYQVHAPYPGATPATPEQFIVCVGDCLSNRVVGRKAVDAGVPALRGRGRVLGTV